MLKIAIDAGHGITTAGKRCLKSIDPKETREWSLNARIANYLLYYLKEYKVTTIRVDDVTGKKDISLSNRCRAANEWGANFYLSIHHNAGVKGGSGGGVVVYTHPNTKQTTHTARDIIYTEVVKENKLKGNRSDGTLSANFQVLRETKMPAVLIECGFMDSTTDTPKILTDEFARKTARGICNGLVKALNLEPVIPPKQEAPEQVVPKMKIYNTLEEIPYKEWKEAVQFALNLPILYGTGDGKLGLTEDNIKALVFLYRYHKIV